MIQRLYIHNFRCLENFEFVLRDISSALLIGRNGAGKSTIAVALAIFQGIGRGQGRLSELISTSDFTRGNTAVPMRFEIEVLLNGKLYHYQLACDLPEHFREVRILEEILSVNDDTVYTRRQANVALHRRGETTFSVDWHLIALPIIQKQANDDLYIFQEWLGNMMILSPIPKKMVGTSTSATLHINSDATNFGDFFTGFLSQYLAAYSLITRYLQEVMPDFEEIENEIIAKNARNIVVRFAQNGKRFITDFEALSDGEKCFILSAVVLAVNKYRSPLFCFWDEPDNYLSMSEVGHFVMALRRSFTDGSQLLVSSHDAETIRAFSRENTFALSRKSHVEPTLIRRLSELGLEGDLIRTLIDGDIEL